MLDENLDTLDEPINVDNNDDTSTPEHVQEESINQEQNSDSSNKIDDNNQDKPDIPDEFKDESGNINIEAVLKFREEHQNLKEQNEELAKQAKLLEDLKAERETIARRFGYKDYAALADRQAELSTSIEIAQFEAASYAQYLHTTDDPQDVHSLLIQYAQSPSPYLLKQIEASFDTSVIKQVAEAKAQKSLEIRQEAQKQEYEKYQQEARAFVSDAVTRHKDMFEDCAFKELFSECIKFAGNRFSSDELVRLARAIGDNAVKRHIEREKTKKENNNDIAGLIDNTPKGKPLKQNTQNINIDELSEAQIKDLVSQNI